MKFLADEDFPKPLVTKIRNLGYSVKTIQQKNLHGSSDETVISMALKEKRIILTFDKDFLQKHITNLQVVIFHFPKVQTSEIILLMNSFLINLKEIKLSKIMVLKFSKKGMEKTEIKDG